MRVYTVECEVRVTIDDVWAYLETQRDDVDELQGKGYEPTNEDWQNAAEEMFKDDDFTYFDFILKK